MPLTLLFLACGPGRRRISLSPLIFAAAPLLVLSMIRHKEMRYLQGIMPFVAISAAALASAWWSEGRRWVTVPMIVLSLLWGLCGLSFLSKSSTAAVLAARDLNRQPSVLKVALPQAWAFGGRFWLADRSIRELPVATDTGDLERSAVGCDAVALYEDVASTEPNLERWLASHGFFKDSTYRHLRSRSVVVFQKRNQVVEPHE